MKNSLKLKSLTGETSIENLSNLSDIILVPIIFKFSNFRTKLEALLIFLNANTDIVINCCKTFINLTITCVPTLKRNHMYAPKDADEDSVKLVTGINIVLNAMEDKRLLSHLNHHDETSYFNHNFKRLNKID